MPGPARGQASGTAVSLTERVDYIPGERISGDMTLNADLMYISAARAAARR